MKRTDLQQSRTVPVDDFPRQSGRPTVRSRRVHTIIFSRAVPPTVGT